MKSLPAFLSLCITPLLLAGSSFSQEISPPRLEAIARPGMPGSLPEILQADIVAPLLDGISPKDAIDHMNKVRLVERKTRGQHDVAIYRALSPSVVLIITKEAMGSGSVVAGGLILTNWHVVGNYRQVGVIYKPDGQGSQPSSADLVAAQVIKTDPTHDLALLKPATMPTGIRPIELGNKSDFSIGSDVHAIGHPSGEAWTYTKGIISQLRDNYSWNAKPNLSFRADVIQTQTPISPGSSGGPLLSDEGKLVGVNSFKDSTAQAINFAVSVVDVRTFLNAPTSLSPASAIANECKGKVIFDGRDDRNTGFMRSISSKCTETADFVVFLPDDKTKPMVAYFDTKGRNKSDAIIFDPSRTGNWQYSYWDVDLDDTFPLKGIHVNGEITPTEFRKRCKGKAGPHFQCL